MHKIQPKTQRFLGMHTAQTNAVRNYRFTDATHALYIKYKTLGIGANFYVTNKLFFFLLMIFVLNEERFRVKVCFTHY